MSCRAGILQITVLFGLGCLAAAAEHTKDTLATIKQNVEDEKAVLVDVREKKEWDAGHIDGAIFLPLSAVQDGLSKDELKPLPKDKVLYVHCVVGKRALTAANALEKAGFKVQPMKPGYMEMIDAEFKKAK
jgi:phage shock protein E